MPIEPLIIRAIHLHQFSAVEAALVERQEIMWVCASLLTVWLLFFALTKRPADP